MNDELNQTIRRLGRRTVDATNELNEDLTQIKSKMETMMNIIHTQTERIAELENNIKKSVENIDMLLELVKLSYGQNHHVYYYDINLIDFGWEYIFEFNNICLSTDYISIKSFRDNLENNCNYLKATARKFDTGDTEIEHRINSVGLINFDGSIIKNIYKHTPINLKITYRINEETINLYVNDIFYKKMDFLIGGPRMIVNMSSSYNPENLRLIKKRIML